MDWNDENGPANEVTFHFKTIDVVGSVVTVCLVSKNWTGNNFTDFYPFEIW